MQRRQFLRGAATGTAAVGLAACTGSAVTDGGICRRERRGGRRSITPRAAGELVPALEVLDGVQSGGVALGHTASYYYVGKTPVMAFGTALPFGLTDRHQNA